MAKSVVNGILEEALSRIKPEKKSMKEADEFLGIVNSRIKKLKINAKAVVGGSFAKGTFLKEDHDVDVFVLFDTKYSGSSGKSLSRMLQDVLKPMKPELVHGSRDYFKIKNMLNFEIVPVLGIKNSEDAENVTDFSPEHVKWFIKKGKKYADDVRLAKKFCKSAKVYGAESYINGFSGHVLDILVVYYKGFIPLLKAAAKWKQKQVIDFNNEYKGNALFELNKSKTQGSLIVVDPVQPGRNASAALADEKLMIFRKRAAEFLKKPSIKFFEEQKADIEKLKKKGAVAVEALPVKNAKEDVAGAKLLKSFEHMKSSLGEFGVKEAGWEWGRKGKALFWFITAKKSLPEDMEWEGPPLIMENRVKDFKKKYKNAYAKNGRVFAKVKRKHTTPESLLKMLAKESYVKERTSKCTIL